MSKLNLTDLTINNLTSNKFIKELPEFYSLKNNIENNPWHKNQTTFNHAVLVLKALKKNIAKYNNLQKYLNEKVEGNTRRDILFAATIFHDISKPQTRIISKEGWTMFPNHEKESANLAKKILKRFDLSKKEIDLISQIIKNHDKIHSFLNHNPTVVSLEKISKKYKDIFLYIVFLTKSDTEGSNLNELMPKLFKTRTTIFNKELSTLKI